MTKNYDRNGKEIDLTGIVVKVSEFPTVYKVIEQIEKEGEGYASHVRGAEKNKK